MLVRAAVDRGSRDNVTVVIVDLSPASPEELAAEAQQAEVRVQASVGSLELRICGRRGGAWWHMWQGEMQCREVPMKMQCGQVGEMYKGEPGSCCKVLEV